MDRELQAMQKGTVHAQGRRRLRLALSGLGGGSCAVAMVLVLVFYGTPYNPMWWAVMAAILVGCALVAALCAPLVEWIIAGYLGRK